MLGLVTKRRLVRELTRQRQAFQWEVSDAKRAQAQAQAALLELQKRVADAIGVHVERPYREDLVDRVVIPVYFSRFALREMGKRLDERTLVRIVQEQVAAATIAALNPADIPELRR